MMKKITIKSCLLCLLIVYITNPALGNDFYNVVNVSKNDTLTLREKPNHKSKKLEFIPFDYKFLTATGNQKVLGKSIWMEVNFKSIIGWVNSRYLKKSKEILFKEDLQCLGTEPFWSVDIKKGKLVFEDLGGDTSRFFVSNIDISDNHNNKWYFSAHSIKNGLVNGFILHTGNCSDDMSDSRYQYQILLHNELNRQTLSGCCNRF